MKTNIIYISLLISLLFGLANSLNTRSTSSKMILEEKENNMILEEMEKNSSEMTLEEMENDKMFPVPVWFLAKFILKTFGIRIGKVLLKRLLRKYGKRVLLKLLRKHGLGWLKRRL